MYNKCWLRLCLLFCILVNGHKFKNLDMMDTPLSDIKVSLSLRLPSFSISIIESYRKACASVPLVAQRNSHSGRKTHIEPSSLKFKAHKLMLTEEQHILVTDYTTSSAFVLGENRRSSTKGATPEYRAYSC